MNALEVFAQYRVDVVESGHKHSRPGWIQVTHCPFCSSNNAHLGYHLAFGYFSCWKCGHHSAFETFKLLKIPWAIAKQLKAGHEPDALLAKKARGGLKEPKGRGPLLPAHVRYLEGRGFDVEACVRLWKAEGIGIAARLAWRVYIPITYRGKTVSWTTRAIGAEVEPRYLSASPEEEALDHKSLVYGLDYVRGAALIVEGPLDVWNVGPGCVGLFGLGYSSAQVRALANVPRRFVCFDRSRDAQARARALASELACFPGVTQVVELDADDPGSASRKEVKAVRKLLA